tara:strand:+ start:468 stop:641 length:174 start_codon:yes stop_codon:yes gene_type:complete
MAKNKKGKEQGADGKACWEGYRHDGTVNGKDKCVEIKRKRYGGFIEEPSITNLDDII